MWQKSQVKAFFKIAEKFIAPGRSRGLKSDKTSQKHGRKTLQDRDKDTPVPELGWAHEGSGLFSWGAELKRVPKTH